MGDAWLEAFRWQASSYRGQLCADELWSTPAHGLSPSAGAFAKYFDNPPVICNDKFVSVLIVFGALAIYRKHVM
jgi:hypothetical protein